VFFGIFWLVFSKIIVMKQWCTPGDLKQIFITDAKNWGSDAKSQIFNTNTGRLYFSNIKNFRKKIIVEQKYHPLFPLYWPFLSTRISSISTNQTFQLVNGIGPLSLSYLKQ
jgi:hypothetical protein